MKPFSKLTIAYLVCSAGLFMAGTTLIPVAGLGGLVRDVLMLSVSGVVLYGLLTVQSARRHDCAAAPDVEATPIPQAPAQLVVRAVRDSETTLQRAA